MRFAVDALGTEHVGGRNDIASTTRGLKTVPRVRADPAAVATAAAAAAAAANTVPQVRRLFVLVMVVLRRWSH